MKDYLQPLISVLDAWGIPYNDATIEKVDHYIQLLVHWNKSMNLSGAHSESEMLFHVIDSVSLLPWIKDQGALLDIGSGAGFPGLPIAIFRPDLQVTLLDSRQKRIFFLRQVIQELQLNNVKPVWGRLEEFRPEITYAMIVSRAVADEHWLVEQSARLLQQHGCWLLMKAHAATQELINLPYPFELHQIELTSYAMTRQVLAITKEKS